MNIIGNSNKKEFTPEPEGLHSAVCCDVVDSGLQQTLWGESHVVTVEEIVTAVRSQGLDGVVAKCRWGEYEPGWRTGAWVKMRIGRARNLSLAAGPENYDALLVGHYESQADLYRADAQRFRAGNTRNCV